MDATKGCGCTLAGWRRLRRPLRLDAVDDRVVRTVTQQISYPLQLMLDLFEFPVGSSRDPADYPKTGEVGSVRGYRRRS